MIRTGLRDLYRELVRIKSDIARSFGVLPPREVAALMLRRDEIEAEIGRRFR